MSLEITPTQNQSRPESGESLAIVPANKHQRAPNLDAHILAMFLLWAKAPRKAEPEIDGSYSLGEIGEDAPKTWERLTPYSLTQRRRDV